MIENKYGIVYLITNKINGKKYVGITTKTKGFNGRYNANGIGVERVYNYLNNLSKTYSPHNEHLLRSITKYGTDNFEVNEEFDCALSKEELLKKERYWIEHFKSNDYTKGYNNTNGGEGLDGGCQNIISKIKRRITNANIINHQLNFWYNDRIKQENKFEYIWDTNDGLNKSQKELLYHKLKGGRTKFCKICGVEYYHSGKGDYCKMCGKDEFLLEYKKYKKEIKKLVIK